MVPNVGLLWPERDTEGLPKPALESPAAVMDSHLSTGHSEWQRRPAEERGGSAATAMGNRLRLASPWSSLEQPRSNRTSTSQHSSPRPMLQEEMGGGGSCIVTLVEGGPTDGWFTAGLGEAAHLWCMNSHGTQDKPAINTHTRERATVMAARYICSTYYISPSPINAFSNIFLCRRAPAKATKVTCGRGKLPQPPLWNLVCGFLI